MVQFGAKVFQTKLSRLSHKACRLLSSPVLLRKVATIITRRNKKLKIHENKNGTEIKYFPQQRLRGFLSVNVVI